MLIAVTWYMTAIVQLERGTAPTGRAVADHLRRTSKQLSRVRDEFLTQGTLSADDGVLRFAVSGMAGYVHRRGTPEQDQQST